MTSLHVHVVAFKRGTPADRQISLLKRNFDANDALADQFLNRGTTVGNFHWPTSF